VPLLAPADFQLRRRDTYAIGSDRGDACLRVRPGTGLRSLFRNWLSVWRLAAFFGGVNLHCGPPSIAARALDLSSSLSTCCTHLLLMTVAGSADPPGRAGEPPSYLFLCLSFFVASLLTPFAACGCTACRGAASNIPGTRFLPISTNPARWGAL